MNQSPTVPVELVGGNILGTAQPLKRRSQGKNEICPNGDRREIRNRMPNDHRVDEALLQHRRDQQRIDYSHVRTNVECDYKEEGGDGRLSWELQRMELHRSDQCSK